MAAASSGSPPKSPASHGDFDRVSGPDDGDLVRADTFDISRLRPGWRRVDESSRHTQPGETGLFAFAPPPPIVRPTAPASPSKAVSKGLIAAGAVALAIVIALPWVLLWSGNRTGDDAATQPVVMKPASPPEVKPALLSVARVPFEPTTPRPQLRPRSLAGVFRARPLESEGRAATYPLEQATAPRANVSPPAPARMEPPADPRTVSAGFAPPPISATTPPPDAIDGALQPATSRHEAPTATPDVTSTPSPAIAVTPSAVPETATADERLVAGALRKFALAYERLDANAVAEVWPHADRRVLSRAFASIESQQLYFERCDVQVSGSAAAASCDGWLTYVPKVGKKDPRSVSRQWDIALHKGAREWQITTAAVR